MGRPEIYNINGRENKPRVAACIAKTMEVPTIVVIAFSLYFSFSLSLSLNVVYVGTYYTHIHTYILYTHKYTLYYNTGTYIYMYIYRRSRANAPRPHCRQLNDTRRRRPDDVHPLHSHAHNNILLLYIHASLLYRAGLFCIRAVYFMPHI